MRHVTCLALLFGVVLGLGLGCGPSNRNSSGDDTESDATAPDCTDGTHRCAASTYQVCNQGTWATQEDCPITCVDAIGCAQCNPGVNVCKDGNVFACDPSGNVGGQVEECTGQNICQNGQCVNACADAATNKSYVGCEYWAADLDNAVEVIGTQGSINCAGAPGVKNVTIQACGNANNSQVAGLCDPPGNTCPANFTCKSMNVCILDAQKSPFAMVVSNPQSRTVNVTVTAANGTTFMRSVSLLIPRTAYDVEYFTMSWPTEDRRMPAPGNHSYHGYLAVVAWEDNTVIEVTPTATVRASATQVSIAANAPTMFTLNAHDILTLQASPGGDLTGTKVRSVNGTSTFGVFGGHEAMGFGEMTPPNQTNVVGPCCADHIEDMMFPTSTWGKTFAIARSQPRGTKELDVLRIMAQKPNTTLTFDPPPTGTCPTLQPGQHCQVKIAADTAITASEPVLVGHYLQSAIWQDPFFGGAVGEGDPSMAIAVPTEQFRTDYTILTPSQYTKNFLSIAAPTNGAVLVDGLPIQMTAFANGMYRATRHVVNAGQHKVTCPGGCGVLVYGYSNAVSYMFAGGLDLKQIVIN
ncbi:MAG: IgGFc-binding protein [Deltaproteobacteria bacterium]|nr:IgGFc-binding protein [Deltaproteobacteria bacterium]MDQ3300089.1 IgGFc-binding protein [Myxococcota bacterium]